MRKLLSNITATFLFDLPACNLKELFAHKGKKESFPCNFHPSCPCRAPGKNNNNVKFARQPSIDQEFEIIDEDKGIEKLHKKELKEVRLQLNLALFHFTACLKCKDAPTCCKQSSTEHSNQEARQKLSLILKKKQFGQKIDGWNRQQKGKSNKALN